MKPCILSGTCFLLVLVLLVSGCMEPPIKEPVVTVSDIALSDVSLRTMTVNASVNVFNPNPVGADLKRVKFDVWYLDDAAHYLGHGEQSNISVKANGNTTIAMPVSIGTVEAVQGVGSLVRKGSILIKVNGTASIDLKLTSYDMPFEQTREFPVSDFTALLPASIPGTGINVTEGIQQLGDLLGAIST